MGSLAADERRARVAGILPGLVDDLKRLVAIPSVSGFGLSGEPLFAAHGLVVDLLRAAGIDSSQELRMESKIAPGVVKLAAPPDAPTAGQQSPGHRSMGPTASPRAIMTGKGP
jgi:cysteinylglycine-S-conjugate dipeptidase